MNKNQLKIAVFDSLRSQLSGYGFVLKPAKDSFVRQHEGIVDVFQLVCLEGKPGLRIQPNVAVRVEEIETIFHQTSGFDQEFQGNTPTIGGAIKNIVGNSNRVCEFVLESNSEVDSVVAKIMNIFTEVALPYFQKYASIKAIDTELNNKPTERTPSRIAPWLRCATGIITAKLTKRSDYEQLVQTYSGIMSRLDKGFYLVRFQALLKSLESIKTMCDPEQGNWI